MAHPRHGFVVAVYLSRREYTQDQPVLIEVYETYNHRGDADSKQHHYNAFDLSVSARTLEVKTIGSIGAPLLGSNEPPAFVLREFPNRYWRRLR